MPVFERSEPHRFRQFIVQSTREACDGPPAVVDRGEPIIKMKDARECEREI
jgi:hypothetical protein